MKTIVSTREETLKNAADALGRVLEEKPDAVLALSAEEDCLALYETVAEECALGRPGLFRARIFSVEELEGMPASEANSRGAKLRAVLEKSGARADNLTLLSEENAADYDALIAAAGGIDLAVLSLGINARVGFNEPATPFDTRTHRQKLAPATRRELAESFGGEERVPVFGLTMGIKTLVEARETLIVSLGASHAKAVFDSLYGRDDSTVPAAFLQLYPNVTLYLDEESAAKL